MKKTLIVILGALSCCLVFANVSDRLLARTGAQFQRMVAQHSPLLPEFLLDMPKGGDIHDHLTGAVYPQSLVQYAHEKHEFWCIKHGTESVSIDPQCAKDHGVLMSYLKPGSVAYRNLIDTWSDKGFHFSKLHDAHNHFFKIFFDFGVMPNVYGPRVLAGLMRQAAHEHINYLELLVQPDKGDGPTTAQYYGKYLTSIGNKVKPALTYPRVLAAIKQLQAHHFTQQVVVHHIVAHTAHMMKAARALLHCNALPHSPACHVTVRFQYYALRSEALPKVFAEFYAGYKAVLLSQKQGYSPFVGVNLVAPEDGPVSLAYYKQDMLIVRYLSRYFHHRVPVTLHAGELTSYFSNVTEHDMSFHVYDAVHIAGANRIGHAVDFLSELQQHPHLTSYMRQHHILIEQCLSSNQQLLGVCDGAAYCHAPTPHYRPPAGYHFNHPLMYFVSHGIPVALCTDDQGILQTNLARQYQMAVTRYPLSYRQLKNIDRNSLSYGFLQGRSLWAQPGQYHRFVKACANDNPYVEVTPSARCMAFLHTSLKARLQWRLERQFAHFEHHRMMLQKAWTGVVLHDRSV